MATEFPLTLLVNKSTNRVLFAEATKEVVDFLVGLLQMPLASVVKVLTTEQMVGSIGNLFQSVSALDPIYLQSSHVKESIVDPFIPSSASYERLILPPATVTKYFRCGNTCRYVANASGMTCPGCTFLMTTEVCLVTASASNVQSVGGAGTNGYVKEAVTYTIMDDLTVTPTSTIFGMRLLKKDGVKDVGVLEEKNVKLGFDEGLKLLQASLQSKTVLSDVFLSSEDRT